jgi:hypothetical protein
MTLLENPPEKTAGEISWRTGNFAKASNDDAIGAIFFFKHNINVKHMRCPPILGAT